MENVHGIVDESRHSSWARFLHEFGNLQEFQHHSKMNKRTFWINSEFEKLGWFVTIMDEINTDQRQGHQVAEGKSLCLHRFRSMNWRDGTSTRSRRTKMERTKWRSQEVFLVPRRSWTRRRRNWIRVENFPGFSSLTILQEIQKTWRRRTLIKPENFKGQIIFMSLFNHILWKSDDQNCISNRWESQELPRVQNKYVDTKHQLADKLTKGNFTRNEWNNLLYLFHISHVSSLCCAQNFSLTSCTRTMAQIRYIDSKPSASRLFDQG